MSGVCLQPRLEQPGKGLSYVDEDQGPQYRHKEGEWIGVPLSARDREAQQAVAAQLGTFSSFVDLIDVPSSRGLGNLCTLLSRRHKTSKGLGHSGVHLS